MIRRTVVLVLSAALVAACDEKAAPPNGVAGATSASAPAGAASTASSASGAATVSAAPSAALPPGSPEPSASAVAAPNDAGAAFDAGAKAGADAGRGASAPSTSARGEASSAPAPAPVGAASAAGAGTPEPPVPPAEAGSADAVAAEVDAIYVGKKAFTARFKQEHTQKVSGVVKKQSGTVVVEKPNKISFRYDPPSQNRIVSDASSLKIYVAEDRQMFVTPVQNSEYPGALSFLLGRGLRPSFTFTFNDKAKFDGGPVLVGKPRTPTPHYDAVMFYIDKALLAKKDPGVVRRVLIVDAQGNRNRFDFEGATQPQSIDPAEFQFTPPPGTDIKQSP